MEAVKDGSSDSLSDVLYREANDRKAKGFQWSVNGDLFIKHYFISTNH